jgi:membrane associated rhomboid family serine protease
MVEAPVGWQCRSCVKQGARVSPTVRWRPRSPGRLGNTRITPVVIGLVVVCVIVYLIEQSNFDSIYSRFALAGSVVYYDHQYYRLITSAFLHLNAQHILLNMITLVIIGPAVEAEIGKVRFVTLYLLAAVGGAVAYCLIAPIQDSSAGASGAIFGVMGAYYVLARRNRWETSTILVLLVINLVYGFVATNVGWQDHLGGLVTGMVVCAAMVYGPSAYGRRSNVNSGVAFEIAAVIVVLVALWLLVMLPPGHVNLS